MIKLFIAGVAFSMVSSVCMAQLQTVSGTIRDAATSEPLPYCTIVASNYPTIGTQSDLIGNFIINVPDEGRDMKLTVSLIGYKTDTVRLQSTIKHQGSKAPRHEVIYLTELKTTLEEVVVSGSSKATSIRENPLAISLVSAREIARTTESNLMESLARRVPGLSTVTTGPNISKPFIRGLGYNRVLTLYDGVRQEGQQWGDEHGIEVDNYNIEKAEVIKGPASLLYGSDAVAGVVSLMPFRPKEKEGKLRGQGLSEYQSNNGLVGNGLRLHSGSKYVFWMVNGSLRKARNYSNRIDGPVYNTGFDEKNIAGLMGFNSARGESRINFTAYDNRQGIPDGSRDSLTRKFTRQVAEGANDKVKDRPLVTDGELRSYTLSPLHQHIQHYRAYTTSSYSLGQGDVALQLGVQQNIRREFNHPTAPDQPGLFVRLNTLNYGIRYNAPEFAGIELSGGINGMLQGNKNRNATDFPIPDYRLTDAGAYGFMIHRHRRWTTSGGARLDSRTIRSSDFYVRANPATGFLNHVDANDTIGATRQSVALRQHFKGVSLSLGTAFRLADKWSLKLNIARGYRAPNIAEIASNGLDPGAHIVYLGNRNFVPEFSFQQDFGVTGEFSDLSVSVNLFHNKVDNYIYLRQLTDAQGKPIELIQGNKTFQYLQSSARLYGAEASLQLHPQRITGLSIDGNISVVFGNNTSTAFRDKGIYGRYLPFIPPVKLMTSLRQEFHTRLVQIPAWHLGTGIDWMAAQERFLALYHTESRTPGYVLVNFSCGIDLRYAATSVMQLYFQVNNVLDETFQSNLSRLRYFEYYSASPGGKLGMYGMGRSLCVKAIIPF